MKHNFITLFLSRVFHFIWPYEYGSVELDGHVFRVRRHRRKGTMEFKWWWDWIEITNTQGLVFEPYKKEEGR